MFVALLGLLDILAAAILVWHLWPELALLLGIVYLIKGLSSILGSIFSGFWFEWMGITDILVGISFVLALEIPFLWIPLFLKGLFSAITGW